MARLQCVCMGVCVSKRVPVFMHTCRGTHMHRCIECGCVCKNIYKHVCEFMHECV